MAKSRKSKSTSAPQSTDVEDAVVVSETKAEAELESALSADGEPVSSGDVATDTTKTMDQPTEDVAEAIDGDVETAELSVEEEASSEMPEQVDEPIEEPQLPEPVAPAQNVTVQKVGFLPLVGGGLVAGGLGFAAAWSGYGQTENEIEPLVTEQAALISDQSGQIEALEAEISALAGQIPAAPDLAPLETEIEAIRGEASGGLTQVGETVAALEARLAETDTRLTAVERAPTEDGGVSETAIASFEREIDALREEITTQEARIQALADSAAADLAAAQEQLAAAEEQSQAIAAQAQAEAEAAEAEAQAAAAEAQEALAAAAAAQLRVALDAGAPFESEIAQLQEAGVDVPEALTAAAAEGLPMQADLQTSFPPLARSALSVARSEGLADQDAGGMSSFFRDQFQTRSIAPREGDDPDAVLSRVEASVGAGDLETALTEISALPDPVQAVFADWRASAEARFAALSAADALIPSGNN